MILLVNGPNLNLLGEGGDGGGETLADVERMVTEVCAGYGIPVKAFQSNSEGALLDFLQEHRREAQGVLLNPGALGLTSAALAECLRALPCPTIEVHLRNVHADDAWRGEGLVGAAAMGRIVGLGSAGYHYAALHLCALVAARAVAQEEGTARPATTAPSARDQLRWAQEQMRARTARVGPAAPPAPPRAPGDTVDGQRIPEEGEPIPVDVNARGDYEPL